MIMVKRSASVGRFSFLINLKLERATSRMDVVRFFFIVEGYVSFLNLRNRLS